VGNRSNVTFKRKRYSQARMCFKGEGDGRGGKNPFEGDEELSRRKKHSPFTTKRQEGRTTGERRDVHKTNFGAKEDPEVRRGTFRASLGGGGR